MDDWNSLDQDAAIYQPRFIVEQKVNIYRYTMSPGLHHALAYGAVGGIATSVTLLLPVRVLLYEQFKLRTSIPEAFSGTAVVLEILVSIIGLGITLLLLGNQWQAPSHKSQYITGAVAGLMFALVTHMMLFGAVNAILANRLMVGWLFQGNALNYDVIYQTIPSMTVEGYRDAMLLLGVLAIGGAGLGYLLIPVGEKADSRGVRDTFGPFLAIIMPVLFQLMMIANIMIFSLINETIIKNYPSATATSTFALILAVFLPLVGQLLCQVIALVWVWNSKPSAIYRSTLRLAQIVYGLGASVGQVLIWWLINLEYLRSGLGQSVTAVSAGLAIAFLILAQNRLYQAGQQRHYARLTISTAQVMGAAQAVLLIGLLALDMFSVRIPYNMMNITIEILSAAVKGQHPLAAIEVLLNKSFFEVLLFWLLWGAIALSATYLPLKLVAWLATLSEKRYFRKHSLI